jgi:hypothetical protein
MPSHTGIGIFTAKIFNRELKISNNSNSERKTLDISLSNLEMIYTYMYLLARYLRMDHQQVLLWQLRLPLSL